MVITSWSDYHPTFLEILVYALLKHSNIQNITCKATSCDVMTPEAGGGCAGTGGDNDDGFTSDSSGSGLEIVCSCPSKITI